MFMKRTPIIFTVFAFLYCLFCGLSFCQDVDLSGTWIGQTEVPDQGADELTLVLEKINGEYTGTASDSLGMLEDVECEDLEFKEGTLTFHFSIFDGYEYMTVWMTLKVEGDKMSGYWETEDGTTGAVEMERVKKKIS